MDITEELVNLNTDELGELKTGKKKKRVKKQRDRGTCEKIASMLLESQETVQCRKIYYKK